VSAFTYQSPDGLHFESVPISAKGVRFRNLFLAFADQAVIWPLSKPAKDLLGRPDERWQ
jgi:hypothetical protein